MEAWRRKTVRGCVLVLFSCFPSPRPLWWRESQRTQRGRVLSSCIVLRAWGCGRGGEGLKGEAGARRAKKNSNTRAGSWSKKASVCLVLLFLSRGFALGAFSSDAVSLVVAASGAYTFRSDFVSTCTVSVDELRLTSDQRGTRVLAIACLPALIRCQRSYSTRHIKYMHSFLPSGHHSFPVARNRKRALRRVSGLLTLNTHVRAAMNERGAAHPASALHAHLLVCIPHLRFVLTFRRSQKTFAPPILSTHGGGQQHNHWRAKEASWSGTAWS